jgi:hypothetical protein
MYEMKNVPEAVRRRYTKAKAILFLHLNETRWERVDWIDLAQDRTSVVNTAMKLGFQKRANFLTS